MRMVKKTVALLVLTMAFAGLSLSQTNVKFTISGKKISSLVYIAPGETESVKLAANDLISDVEKVSGRKLQVVNELPKTNEPVIIIGTLMNKTASRLFQKLKLNLQIVDSQWETYQVMISGRNLVFAGSDDRGTMFAIYHFLEEYLGVDPLYFWSGKEPGPKEELVFENVNLIGQQPTFKYRGWFINDEDLLSEWKDGGGRRNIDYPYYKQVVAPDVMERVVEALVRLRFNLIIPASFLDIGNPEEEKLVKVAAKRGVFISQHHIEPLGVSAFTFFNYWKAKNNTSPLFSYYSNKEQLVEVWKEYAKKWAHYPNVIWQIGLRGIGDRPMWMADTDVPQSDADRGKIITEALNTQLEIIKSVDKRKNPPMTMTLWAEGSYLFHEGFLKIPEEAHIIFSDNSPGWKFQEDFYSTARDPGRKYGVYYHHQLWGSGPHLAQAVPPSQTYKAMGEAVRMNSDSYCIMNVSNIREFQLGIAASSQMLTNFRSFNPDNFLSDWCRKYYPSMPEKVEELYKAYFSAFVLHGNRQVPMLLDGQTNGPVNQLLREIENKFMCTEKEPVTQPNIKADTKRELEKSWAAKSLGDMHPQAGSPHEWMVKAGLQRYIFSDVINKAESLRAGLTSFENTYLESNLLSHAYFMKGLSQRLEYTVLAHKAVSEGDRALSLHYLKMVYACYGDIQKARILGSAGKWADWYRGDRKMNLQGAESRISGLIEKLEQNSK